MLLEKWVLRVNSLDDIRSYLLSKYGEIHRYFENWGNSCYLYSDDCWFSSPKYASVNENSVGNLHTQITLEQFKEHFYKEKQQNNMKPQPFIINGKEHHLRAIYEDLKEFGYRSICKPNDCIKGCITTNASDNSFTNNTITKDKYKELFIGDDFGKSVPHKRFLLPQDYQKALDYAKEALDDKNWEEEFKVGEWLYRKTSTGEQIARYSSYEKSLLQSNELYYIYDKNVDEYLGGNFGDIKDWKKATREQIERILKEVAKHKGYEAGKTLEGCYNFKISDVEQFYYKNEDDVLWNGTGMGRIYEYGTWNKVKETPITIGGYEANFERDESSYGKPWIVKFGCQSFTKEEILNIKDVLKRKDTNITIHGYPISLEFVDKVLYTLYKKLNG